MKITKSQRELLVLSIIVGLLILGIIAMFVGLANAEQAAEEQTKAQRANGHWMPKGASNIKDVGNGWQEFTYKGERFLFYRHTGFDTGYACIVKLESK